MGFDNHVNFGYSTVATAPSPASSGTSLVVASGDGSKFPAAPFNATVWPANAQPTDANAEIVRVTAKSTDTLTITRAQEGTSARAIGVGDQIAATSTAKTFTDIEAAAASPLTTKGDIHGYSTVDARIPVGSNGQILQADSSQALGVKWAGLSGTGLVELFSTTLGATGALDTGASAIPTGHGHLIVYFICRSAVAAANEGMTLRFNGDSGSNYNQNFVWAGGGTTPSSGQSDGQTSISAAALITGDTSTAGKATALILEIPFYDNTHWNKLANLRALTDSGTSTGRLAIVLGSWLNTAAINQITLDTPNHLLANSQMVVYGTV